MKFLPTGTIIELIEDYTKIYSAKSGAQGIIEGRLQEEGFDYYQIIWDKDDPRVNGQEDGLIDCHHVKAYKGDKGVVRKDEYFDFSKELGIKTLKDDNITAFLTIVIKNDIPYVVTDAKTAVDALKIIPDIMAIANQLVETCVQSSISAYDTIERLKNAVDKIDLELPPEDEDF